jgi:TetR/AcrR family transcriptional repressor of mexJK operon
LAGETGVTPSKRGSGGRPTREEAVRRDERIVEVATQFFMERGFDATTIDAVAETAGVSKPTVYARYPDKRHLFTAVLRSRIEDWIAPISAATEEQAREAGPKDLATALHDLSRAVLAHSSQPGASALKRCLVAQALHFPELAKLAHEEGWMRAVRGVATLLGQFEARGQIKVSNRDIAADLFLSLVLGRHSQSTLFAIPIDPEAQEERREAAVNVFINGVGV